MEFGVYLPLLAFRGQAFSLSRLLVDYAETAEQLGFTTLCADDHLTFSRPWLESITALASVLTKTRHMTLMTTVALPVVRGPVPLAKSLAFLAGYAVIWTAFATGAFLGDTLIHRLVDLWP
jgi:predicted metal-binding membrane protein